MTIPLEIAKRFIGLKEISGDKDDYFILWCLSLCKLDNVHDETPWCSAFANGIAYISGVERSYSAAARSWLSIGTPVNIIDAIPGFDVAVFTRGDNLSSGHVGFYLSQANGKISIVGGNQSNQVSISSQDIDKLLGIRRLKSL